MISTYIIMYQNFTYLAVSYAHPHPPSSSSTISGIKDHHAARTTACRGGTLTSKRRTRNVTLDAEVWAETAADSVDLERNGWFNGL